MVSRLERVALLLEAKDGGGGGSEALSILMAAMEQHPDKASVITPLMQQVGTLVCPPFAFVAHASCIAVLKGNRP